MKRALVTGASSAIGAAIAAELAADGLHVVCHAHRRGDAVRGLCARIEAAGGSAEPLTLDLTDDAARQPLAAMAESAPIQVLVHAVGHRRDKPFAAMEADDWHEVVGVNLDSFFVALRPLVLPMMRTRWGRVVAVSSLTAVLGNRGQVNYAAAKGGLLAAAKSLTREYGARGLTFNVVAPGLIDTPEARALANFDDLVRLAPMGRAGSPDEVAALVAFLASEKAGYLSGQLIGLDGGSS